MNPKSVHQVDLPDALKRQFEGVERRLWRVETMVAVGLAICALLASYFAVFFLDRLWDTHPLVRTMVSLGGFAVFGYAGYRWFRNWVYRRRDKRFLAMLVQRRFRRLGDRLLSVVELADEKQHPGEYSEALYRAAIDQVAGEAGKYDFEETVQLDPIRHYSILLGVLGVALILLVLSAPQAAMNAFQRWIKPGANVERLTLINLSGLPEQKIVPHGEPFEVACDVDYSTIWKPATARYWFQDQSKQEAKVVDKHLTLAVPGVVDTGNLNIRLGDAEESLRIQPTYRPFLKRMTAKISLPDYLKYPVQTEEAAGGSLTVLEGSRVELQGEVSRELSAASVQWGDETPRPLNVEGPRFRSDPASLDTVFQMTFNWEDRLGLTNAAPWTLTVQTEEDQPPVPEFRNFPRVGAMLETEVLNLEIAGHDDYGVKELGLAWRLFDATSEETEPRRMNYVAENSQQTELVRSFQFSPALQSVPAGAVVELRGWATDFFPDRELALTPVHRIQVIGLEEHAEMIRQKMESVLVQLDEITRLEETIADETGNLTVTDPEDFEDGGKKEDIEELENSQRRNSEDLESLARKGMETLREALRNPVFTESTLREWTENLSAMNSLAQGQMQQAASQLQTASNSSQSAPQELEQALQTEEEILERLASLRETVNEDLDNLQALTLSQRLRLMGKREDEIANDLKRIVSQTIGMLPEELSDRLQNRTESISGDQGETRDQSVELKEEISRFAERTRLENYQKVSEEMSESRTDEALEALRGLIQENRSMKSMQQLIEWAGRFNEWADRLQPPESEGGGSGQGGGSGEAAQRVMEMLLTLLRTREGEVDLRQQTRLLDEDPSIGDEFKDKASILENRQKDLGEKIESVQNDNPIQALDPVLTETRNSMLKVERLLNLPRTDQVTDGSQEAAIALLSDAINLINEFAQRGGAGKGSPSQASSEQMAFLLQMMSQGMKPGMMPGPTGGGYTGGGTTDRTAAGLSGGSDGKAGEERGVESSAGTVRNFPVEFREALQNYFNAIESEEQ